MGATSNTSRGKKIVWVRRRARHGSTQAIFEEINITPFTDVLLVLLIIFVITGSAMAPVGLAVSELAISSTSTSALDANSVLEVKVFDAKGVLLTYNNEKMDFDKLGSIGKDVPVVLTASRDVRLENVLQVYEELVGKGFMKISWGPPA